MTHPTKPAAARELAEAVRAYIAAPSVETLHAMTTAQMRYDAAREVSTTPLPEPWEWCRERPENVECRGCGFEMYGGHVDTSHNPVNDNTCPVCAKSAALEGGDDAD